MNGYSLGKHWLSFKKLSGNARQYLFSGILLLLITTGVIYQKKYYAFKMSKYYAHWNDLANISATYQAIKWIDNNHKNKTVILAEDWMSSEMVSIYTKNDILISFNFYNGRMTKEAKEDFVNRMEVYFSLWGTSPMEYKELIYKDFKIQTYLFGWRRFKNSSEDGLEDITDEEVESMVKNYRQKKPQNLLNALKRYQVEYILYGPYEKALFKVDLGLYPFLKKVYDTGKVQIFSVTKNL